MVPKERSGSPGKPDRPQPSGRPPPLVTRKVAAEAATWIARLHGPSRSPEMERAFREWVSSSEAHGYAFERCSDIWTDIQALTPAQVFAGMARRDMKAAIMRERIWQRVRWPVWVVLILAVAGGSYALYRWLAVDVYTTGIGGQQQVLLADGSRMSMNTNTKVRVEFDAAGRSLSLDAGEAMFEVAKDPRRPFVVHAGRSEVIAVGTVFMVRVAGRGEASDGAVSVVLVEGAVSVLPEVSRSSEGRTQQRLGMQAGERMRLYSAKSGESSSGPPQLDRPPLDTLVAWKRGEAIFGDLSLREAAAEMNRYTRAPVVLVGDVAELRISGSYRTGDTLGFAQAVAELHGLKVREHDGRLELSRPQ